MRFIRLKQPLKLHLVKYKKRKKKRNEAVVSRNFEKENFPVMWIQTSVKFYDSVSTIFHSQMQVTATSPMCSTYYSFNKYTGDIKILSLQKTYLFLQQRPMAKVIKGALHNFHQTRRAWDAFDPNVFLPFLNGKNTLGSNALHQHKKNQGNGWWPYKLLIAILLSLQYHYLCGISGNVSNKVVTRNFSSFSQAAISLFSYFPYWAWLKRFFPLHCLEGDQNCKGSNPNWEGSLDKKMKFVNIIANLINHWTPRQTDQKCQFNIDRLQSAFYSGSSCSLNRNYYKLVWKDKFPLYTSNEVTEENEG